MSIIDFNHQSYSLNPEENVLQCLLRHGVDYPNSCQAGICQSCLIKAKNGWVDPSWQEGLPATLQSQGYFLACLAKPKLPLQIVAPNHSECEVHARIMKVERLNYNVMQVKLSVEQDLSCWIPGQYLSLINSAGTMRNYSIANIPIQDGYIELHIKIYPNGCMGQWLIDEAENDTDVRLRGPFGRCFYYNPESLTFDMLLAGTGTGLAPLIAIVKSALNQNHQGRITLVHGGLTDEDIYFHDELENLSTTFKSFVYDPCVVQSKGRYPEALVEQRALKHITHPCETKVYVCGPKETTQKLKTSIFLSGVPSQSIYSDAFL